MGMGAAHKGRLQHVGKPQVIYEPAGTGEQRLIFNPRDGFADRAALLHARAPGSRSWSGVACSERVRQEPSLLATYAGHSVGWAKGRPSRNSAHAKSSRAVPTRIRIASVRTAREFFRTVECEEGRAFAHPTNRLVRLRIRCKVSGSRQSRPAATPAQSPMRSSTRRSRSATE